MESVSFDRNAANVFQSYVQSALAFSIKRGGILYGTGAALSLYHIYVHITHVYIYILYYTHTAYICVEVYMVHLSSGWRAVCAGPPPTTTPLH